MIDRCPGTDGHAKRYEWLASNLGHFTDVDASCVLDLDSTCHTGGWCFGSLLGNWRVWYAPRIQLEGVPSCRGPFCDAGWLSENPSFCTDCGAEYIGFHRCPGPSGEQAF